MNVSGNYLRNCWEEMFSSDHMAYQGTVIELAVPLSHLAQFTDGPIYLNHLDVVGFSFGNIYDESDWSGDDWCDEDYYLVYWDAWDDPFMEDFWGYRVDLGNLSCESITPGDPCAATPESVEKMTQTAVDMLGSAGSMEELLAYAQGLLTEQLTFDNPQRRLEFDPIPPQDFACGTFSQTLILGGLDFTFTFTGQEGCLITSGTISGQAYLDGNIIMAVDVTTAACSYQGNLSAHRDTAGDITTTNFTFENFSVCGVMISGNGSIVYDNNTHELVSMNFQLEGNISYEGETIAVTANLTIDQAGLINGMITLAYSDCGTYTFEVNNLTIDPECGLPTSVTLRLVIYTPTQPMPTILAAIDFSSTSCENPAAQYTILGGVQGTIYFYD